MNPPATISTDVLATYAADAAREVAGVRGFAESHLPGKRGVRVTSREEGLRVELHLVADWDASLPKLGRAVQQRVQEYLRRMAAVEAASVDVVVEEIGPRP